MNYEKRNIYGIYLWKKELMMDPTLCDFYLWRKLKNKVYVTNPHMLDELKNNVLWEIKCISAVELMRVNANFVHDVKCA